MKDLFQNLKQGTYKRKASEKHKEKERIPVNRGVSALVPFLD